MTRLSGSLQALLEAEQRAVGPTAEAAAACWDSIAADLERGALPALDIPPPAPPRHGAGWLTLTLVGIATLAAALYVWRADESRAELGSVAGAAPIEPVPASKDTIASLARAPVLPAATDTPSRAPESPVPSDISNPSAVISAPAPEEPATAPDPTPLPTAPRPRRASAEDPVPEDTFAAELALLAKGHAALNRGDTAEALRVADLYKKTYPRGHFKEDRDALRALTRCVAGDGSDAARKFLRAHPKSIHVTRLREACDLPAEPGE